MNTSMNSNKRTFTKLVFAKYSNVESNPKWLNKETIENIMKQKKYSYLKLMEGISGLMEGISGLRGRFWHLCLRSCEHFQILILTREVSLDIQSGKISIP